MSAIECFYHPVNACGGQFSGTSPPAGWKEVICDGCAAKLGWACPSCAATEDCLAECESCAVPIPPPIGSPLPPGQEDPFRQVEAIIKGAARRPQQPPRRPSLSVPPDGTIIDTGWLEGDTEQTGSTGASPDSPPAANDPPPDEAQN